MDRHGERQPDTAIAAISDLPPPQRLGYAPNLSHAKAESDRFSLLGKTIGYVAEGRTMIQGPTTWKYLYLGSPRQRTTSARELGPPDRLRFSSEGDPSSHNI
jgi:hypothetical protein